MSSRETGRETSQTKYRNNTGEGGIYNTIKPDFKFMNDERICETENVFTLSV